MKRTHRFLSLLLVAAMVFGVFGSFTIASAVEPREPLLLPYTVRVTEPYTRNRIDVTVYYSERYEASNSSGRYIAAINSATAVKVEGINEWVHVSYTVKITGVTYGNNHQIANVGISYEASIGAGYNTYTDTVVIDLTK